MPPITDKSTALIVKIGVVYGFSASTYLAAWNSWDLILKKPFPFGLLSHEYLFLGFPILHAVMLVLCFQERSNGDLHWGSLLIAPLGLVRGAKYVLTFSVLYFFVLVLILIANPDWQGAIQQAHWEAVLTSLFLVQTLYVGSFFLIGREKLLSRELRALLDWPALLGQLLRKIGRY
jgi:hypothetical protein